VKEKHPDEMSVGGLGVYGPLTYNWPSRFYKGGKRGKFNDSSLQAKCACCLAVNVYRIS